MVIPFGFFPLLVEHFEGGPDVGDADHNGLWSEWSRFVLGEIKRLVAWVTSLQTAHNQLDKQMEVHVAVISTGLEAVRDELHRLLLTVGETSRALDRHLVSDESVRGRLAAVEEQLKNSDLRGQTLRDKIILSIPGIIIALLALFVSGLSLYFQHK